MVDQGVVVGGRKERRKERRKEGRKRNMVS